MPELPEVESTVRYLKERIEGLAIKSSEVLWHRTIAHDRAPLFSNLVSGSAITSVFRCGKFVGMRLEGSSEQFLFTHLRMSGSLDVLPDSMPLEPHDRVVLYLSNGKSLRFNDTRKFGRMYLVSSPEEVTARIGVEPLSDSFTPEALDAILRARKGAVKPTLLNQALIAGLGNIYVDESLWTAHIHPLTPCNRIPPEKRVALHAAIVSILSKAVSLLGTDFGDGVVDGGMYSPVVYGREGEPCKRCKSEIRRIVVGQRGTHICPTCQARRSSAKTTKRKDGTRRKRSLRAPSRRGRKSR